MRRTETVAVYSEDAEPPRARPQTIGLRQWLDEIVAYSELLTNLVARDLKTKYRGSFFGIFWSLLNPLLLMLVYTLVFSLIVRVNIHPYPVFLLAGLVPWNAFAQSLIQATTSVTDSRGIVSKVAFPRQVLPLSAVLSGSVNFLISLGLLAILTVVLHPHLGWSILLLPLLVLLQVTFTFGLGAILAAAQVYFRDVQYFVGVFLTAWFFLTPVVYSIDFVPPRLRPILLLNPMAWDISSFQAIWFYGRIPSVGYLVLFAAVAGLSLLLGIIVFGRLSRRFAEEV
ncbi:MAG: ABC transporter permease [Candidatus Dormibacter sp.]